MQPDRVTRLPHALVIGGAVCQRHILQVGQGIIPFQQAFQVVEQGAQRLGTTVDELITQCILGMRECAPAIGLAGDAPEA